MCSCVLGAYDFLANCSLFLPYSSPWFSFLLFRTLQTQWWARILDISVSLYRFQDPQLASQTYACVDPVAVFVPMNWSSFAVLNLFSKALTTRTADTVTVQDIENSPASFSLNFLSFFSFFCASRRSYSASKPCSPPHFLKAYCST